MPSTSGKLTPAAALIVGSHSLVHSLFLVCPELRAIARSSITVTIVGAERDAVVIIVWCTRIDQTSTKQHLVTCSSTLTSLWSDVIYRIDSYRLPQRVLAFACFAVDVIDDKRFIRVLSLGEALLVSLSRLPSCSPASARITDHRYLGILLASLAGSSPRPSAGPTNRLGLP